MANFHDRLKCAMDLRGLTQSELCKRTKIPKSAMSQYMSGAFKPKDKRTYLLAKALNVDEAWLMGYDVPMTDSENISSADTNHTYKEKLTENQQALFDFISRLDEEKARLAIRIVHSLLDDKE